MKKFQPLRTVAAAARARRRSLSSPFHTEPRRFDSPEPTQLHDTLVEAWPAPQPASRVEARAPPVRGPPPAHGDSRGENAAGAGSRAAAAAVPPSAGDTSDDDEWDETGPRAAAAGPPPPARAPAAVPSSSESESDSDSDSDDEAPPRPRRRRGPRAAAAAAAVPLVVAERPERRRGPRRAAAGPGAVPFAVVVGIAATTTRRRRRGGGGDAGARGLGAAACPRTPRVGDFWRTGTTTTRRSRPKVLGRVVQVGARPRTSGAPGSTATRRRATSRSGGGPPPAPPRWARLRAGGARGLRTRPRRRPRGRGLPPGGRARTRGAARALRRPRRGRGAHRLFPARRRSRCQLPRVRVGLRAEGGRRRRRSAPPAPADDDADLVCAPKRRPLVAADAEGRAMSRWPVVGDRLLQRHNDVDPLEAEHVRARVSDFQAPPPVRVSVTSPQVLCVVRRCSSAPRRRRPTWRSRTRRSAARQPAAAAYAVNWRRDGGGRRAQLGAGGRACGGAAAATTASLVSAAREAGAGARVARPYGCLRATAPAQRARPSAAGRARATLRVRKSSAQSPFYCYARWADARNSVVTVLTAGGPRPGWGETRGRRFSAAGAAALS